MDVAGIERELAEIWAEASAGEDAVVRACMLNLVVACRDGGLDLLEATRLVAGISENEPNRALVLAPHGPRLPNGLDAYFSPHCHRGAGGRLVCSEQITVCYDGGGAELLPETVLQLLVGELPVVCWWRRPGLESDALLSRLLGFANVLLIDSAGHRDSAAQVRALAARLAGGPWHGRAIDVDWARGEPWREAVAALFDAPDLIPWLERVTAVTIVEGGAAGEPPGSAALYLAGWLASRLRWTPARASGDRPGWRRPDGAGVRVAFARDPGAAGSEVSEIGLEAAGAGGTARFEARRYAGRSRIVELRASARQPCGPPTRIQLPERDPTALLCGSLERAQADPLFAPALHAAAMF
jgi:hypothetical protein